MKTLGLIGLPNAGKSTLFNRLIGSYRAIITDIPGTTRDILRQETSLEDLGTLEILDSPGLDKSESELPYIKKIIEESDVIILVIDYKNGRTASDEEIVQLVRRAGKIHQLIVFVNKVDQEVTADKAALIVSEFEKFGVKSLVLGSAQHGRIQQLLTSIEKHFPPEPSEGETLESDNFEKKDLREENTKLMLDDVTSQLTHKNIPVALVGRPNVGKSTLINTISKKNLSKVSEIPGTTLDYLSYEFSKKGQDFVLYDTAGMRRPGRTKGLERIAKDKTLGMLRYVNPVVLFLMDGEEGVTKTDRNALGDIAELNLPILILINKIDLLDVKQKKTLLKAVEEFFGDKNRNFTLGISAKNGTNISKIRSKVEDLRTRAHQQLSTGQLNKIIKQGFLSNPPTFPHNRAVKVYYATQIKTYPPSFMVFINNKDNLTQAFKNRLESKVRMGGGYEGISLQFLFKDKKMDEKGYEEHLKRRGKAIRARAKKHPGKLRKKNQ